MAEIIEEVDEYRNREDSLIINLTEEDVEDISGAYGGTLVETGDILIEIHIEGATRYSKKGTFSFRISSEELSALKDGRGILYEDVDAKPLRDYLDVVFVNAQSLLN